ncbi:hypothetical protein [Komagataeibacter saccharivorans]|uniref:hypothetical protein n=1 Tax=Komagataeibacter saccharivorans TaxID=265959 RepID=UPI0014043A05|nr:hypothetical protein [Komagataeibacter saccharivorans]
MNVWVPEKDRAAFLAAVTPFRNRAREIEQAAGKERKPIHRAYRLTLTFPVAPPATARNAMKASGWRYDRAGDVWTVEVTGATDDARLKEAASLKIDHGGVIDFI